MPKKTVSTCKNCGARVVLVNYVLGERWEHQPAGAAFQDGIYTYCRSMVATPMDD